MRKTPVEDYLEEISTTLPEEIYGRLSDAIYETNADFDQEIESRVAENAKLRELCADMWRLIEDLDATPYVTERQGNNPAVVWLDEDWSVHESCKKRIRELGVEVE